MSRQRSDEQRKSQIRAAGIHCFVRRGFNATRLLDIARQAGLSKGGVYFHYNTKEALFQDILDEQLRQLEGRWAFEPVADQPADRTLERLVVAHLRTTEDEPDETRLGHLLLSMAPQEEPFRAKLEGGFRVMRTLYSGVIHRGIREGVFRSDEPEALADCVLALVQGLAMQSAVDPDGKLPIRPEDAAQTVLAMLSATGAALRQGDRETASAEPGRLRA